MSDAAGKIKVIKSHERQKGQVIDSVAELSEGQSDERGGDERQVVLNIKRWIEDHLRSKEQNKELIKML